MKRKVQLSDGIISGFDKTKLLGLMPELVFKQRKTYDEYYYMDSETPEIEVTISLLKNLSEMYYPSTVDIKYLTIKL